MEPHGRPHAHSGKRRLHGMPRDTLTTIHGAKYVRPDRLPDCHPVHGAPTAACAKCHESKDNWSKTADCVSCHSDYSPADSNHYDESEPHRPGRHASSAGLLCSDCHSMAVGRRAPSRAPARRRGGRRHRGLRRVPQRRLRQDRHRRAGSCVDYPEERHHACGDCHNDDGGLGGRHMDRSSSHQALENTSCDGASCHGGIPSIDMEILHYTAEDGAGNTYCKVCHTDGADTPLAGSSCGDGGTCHADKAAGNHGYDPATHLAAARRTSRSPVRPTDVACETCHSAELGPVHTTAILGRATQAARCQRLQDRRRVGQVLRPGRLPHRQLVAADARSVDSSHAIPAARSDCLAAAVTTLAPRHRFEGKSLAEIHEDARRSSPRVVPDLPRDGHHADSRLHELRLPPDRPTAHGYPAEAHVADESCVLDCHAATPGMTELKPLHDAAKGTSVACTACHDDPGSGLREPLSRGMGQDVHGVPRRSPISIRLRPRTTPEPTRRTRTRASSATAAARRPGTRRCSAATASATSPTCTRRWPATAARSATETARRRRRSATTCHKPGYATTYTVPGTPSADIFATTSPSNDEYITPGLDVHDHSGKPARLLRGQHSVDVGDPGKVRDDHVHRRRRSSLRVQRTVDTVERQDHPRRDLRERGRRRPPRPLGRCRACSRSAGRRT